jgi:hypothetical protein
VEAQMLLAEFLSQRSETSLSIDMPAIAGKNGRHKAGH